MQTIQSYYVAPGAVVSHGTATFLDVNQPVEIDGLLIRPGDLLHGDANGIVIVPPAILDQLPRAIDAIRERERQTMDFVKSPDFTLEGLKKIVGY